MSFVDPGTMLLSEGGAGNTLNQIKSAVSLGKAMAGGSAAGVAEQAIDILKNERSEVQQMLSFELRLVENLPELVVRTIATSDDPSVSVPFLEVSPAVSEALLLSVMDELHASAQNAVARRPDVTDAVAGALIDRGNEKAALSLARNDKIEISQDVLERIVANFPNDARILQSANQAISRAREFGPAAPSAAALPFNVLISRARAFHKNGMLTAEYISKLLNQGSLLEFEASLCVLSGKTRKEMRVLALSSEETLLDLERLCQLAPGALCSNQAVIKACYSAARDARTQ